MISFENQGVLVALAGDEIRVLTVTTQPQTIATHDLRPPFAGRRSAFSFFLPQRVP